MTQYTTLGADVSQRYSCLPQRESVLALGLVPNELHTLKRRVIKEGVLFRSIYGDDRRAFLTKVGTREGRIVGIDDVMFVSKEVGSAVEFCK